MNASRSPALATSIKLEESNMTRRTIWLYTVVTFAGGAAGGALMIHLAAGVAMAAKPVRTLTAERLVLADADGRHRIVIGVAPDGAAEMAMYDDDGRERAEFRVARDGAAAIGFYDRSGLRRVLIGEAVGGRNGIAIYGTSGRQVASLATTEDNSASLTLYDPATGRARAGLGDSSAGLPALALFDQNGKDRVEIHVKPDGAPGVALADESGKSIAGLPQKNASAQ